MIPQLWFYQISCRLEKLTWQWGPAYYEDLGAWTLYLRRTSVGFCCPFRSQCLSVPHCIISSCVRPQKQFLAMMSILWVYPFTAEGLKQIYLSFSCFSCAFLSDNHAAFLFCFGLVWFFTFSLKGSGLDSGMQLIRCRALRVDFIHYLFQRSSLEEELGLFRESFPANSQIRLF